MSTAPTLPAQVETLDHLAQLEAAAERLTTPCGEGELCWHRWGQGEPVLLLHGGSGSWNHWARNIAPLVAAGRQVLAPDLPGFGDSAPPPDGHDADAMPRWIELGLQSLVGPRGLDVVGFSFGGMVAGQLAADHPERVRRLVLAGAPSVTEAPLAELDLRVWSHVPAGPERDAVFRHNLLQLMLLHPASVSEMVLAMQKDNLRREDRRMKRRNLSRQGFLRRVLPRVQAPVWGIWAADDALFRHCRDEIAPGLTLAPRWQSLRFIENVGHWVQFEGAPAFDAALREILDAPLPG